MAQCGCQQRAGGAAQASNAAPHKGELEGGRKPGDAVGGSGCISSWGHVSGQVSGHPNTCQRQAHGLARAEAKLRWGFGERGVSTSSTGFYSFPPKWPSHFSTVSWRAAWLPKTITTWRLSHAFHGHIPPSSDQHLNAHVLWERSTPFDPIHG